MKLRKVTLLLIGFVSFISINVISAAEFQQIQIKGPKNSTEQFSGTVYGPIDSSDTLWRIANRYRQNKNLSLYQVMAAIYQLNPSAFEDQNLNLLKNGSTLKLPSERYIATIDPEWAKQKAMQDDQSWTPTSGAGNPSNNLKPAEKLASKHDLDQTKDVLEKKLTDIDAEQNRQFSTIRQQFADSISSIQSLLDNNQKLYDRLDTVNQDIESLRSEQDVNKEQTGEILQIQSDILAMLEQKEAEERAEREAAKNNWMEDPFTIVITSGVITLLAMILFGVWLLKRKKKTEESEDIFANTPSAQMMEQNTEMDDLSDALSDELSGDLKDDGLFGEDDLLDDVLSNELEESLDEVLDEELDDFDDLSDEMLVPDGEEAEKFEEGSDVLEQDDLDSLFDEDDDLLAELDEDVDAIDLSETEEAAEETQEDEIPADDVDDEYDTDDDLDELPVPADSPQPEEPGEPVEEIQLDNDDEAATDTDQKAAEEILPDVEPEFDSQEEVISSVTDDDEQPEISIDELLEEQSPTAPDIVDAVDSPVISEEGLQQIDEEITTQGQELDKVTEDLLNELEQIEMMEGMLSEDDDDDESDEPQEPLDPQHSIQELDALSPDPEDIADDGLGDDNTEKLNIGTDDEPEAEPEPAAEPEPEAESEPEAELEPDDVQSPDDFALETEQDGVLAGEQSDTTENLDEDAGEELGLDISEIEVEPVADESGEDELEKALQDFEEGELDEVLEDLSSDALAEPEDMSDLELDGTESIDKDFTVEDELIEEESNSGNKEQDKPKELSLDDIGSIADLDGFDDSELEQAFDGFDHEDNDDDQDELTYSNDDRKPARAAEPDALDDLPGLGDWLEGPEESKDTSDEEALDELENASFDEILDSLDDEDDFQGDEPESALDLEALLSEESTPDESSSDISEDDLVEEDFLDVEALLSESVGAESEPIAERALDLDVSLEDYSGVTDDEDLIDVDKDQGISAKLDLARAYVEIDDIDAAKELLLEVIEKGDEEVQQEAREVLAELNK